jgi:hypothetical protein
MHIYRKQYLAIFALSLIAAPICAAHTDKALWAPTQPMKFGEAQVKPGNYRLKAYEDDNEVQVMQGDKVVATVFCFWIDLPMKAASTEIKANDQEVTEVQFKGRPLALIFPFGL